MIDNFAFLTQPYPGRVVLLHRDASGRFIRQISATAGRSEGSRNRIYVQEGDTVRTEVFDQSKQKGDAASTLYVALCNEGAFHVVSNGAQTTAIARDLAKGLSFDAAQRPWANEGPAGSYTTRISAAINAITGDTWMGKVARHPLDFEKSLYISYGLDLLPATGAYLTTYDGQGGTEPNTQDPLWFEFDGSLEDLMAAVWNKMQADTRLSLAGKEIELSTGKARFAPLMNANLK
jgi:IMP cyclohydrolase